MARWKNDWPTKLSTRIKTRLETEEESYKTSQFWGSLLVLASMLLGAAADETIRGLLFVWKCLHGGH